MFRSRELNTCKIAIYSAECYEQHFDIRSQSRDAYRNLALSSRGLALGYTSAVLPLTAFHRVYSFLQIEFRDRSVAIAPADIYERKNNIVRRRQ